MSGERDLKSSSYLPQHDLSDGQIAKIYVYMYIYISDKNMALPVERYGFDAQCHSERNTGSNSHHKHDKLDDITPMPSQ